MFSVFSHLQNLQFQPRTQGPLRVSKWRRDKPLETAGVFSRTKHDETSSFRLSNQFRLPENTHDCISLETTSENYISSCVEQLTVLSRGISGVSTPASPFSKRKRPWVRDCLFFRSRCKKLFPLFTSIRHFKIAGKINKRQQCWRDDKRRLAARLS